MKRFLFLFLVGISTTLCAQEAMKYGKIKDADLSMTSYELAPDAAALVLGENMKVDFTIRGDRPILIYKYHLRLKILDKKGFDKADVQIPYYAYRRGEKVNRIKAQTLNWNNGKREAILVSKNDIFDEKKNDYISYKKFSFPGVEVGSVLELTYELQSEYYLAINDKFFQRDIPVRWSTYDVKVPEMFVYRYDIQGTHAFSVRDKKSIMLNLGGGFGSIDGTAYKWEMKDIPALKKEPYITSMKDYYAAVRMRLSSYEPSYGLHEKYISTWPAMNNLYYRVVAEKSYLKDRNSSKIWKAAKPQIEGQSPKERLETLYQFVQDNITWNEVEEIKPDHSSDHCFSEKEGSNTEINLALLTLLKKAGIEAYPLLISTRDDRKPMNFLPYLYQFNQTLVVAVIDEKMYYLDASHKDYPMTVLHPNNLNFEGWMVKGETEGRWMTIAPSKSSKVLAPALTLAEDGTVSGQLKTRVSGYPALDCKLMIEKSGEEAYLEQVYRKNLPNTDFEDIKFENLESTQAKLKENMAITSTDMAQAAGDMIYVNPILKPTFSENLFQAETRTIPVDMPYGVNEQYILSLTIPEGYVVEELPEPLKIVLPNEGASYSFSSSLGVDGKIQVVARTKITQTYYMPEEYGALRNFFDLMINKQNEQIVLKKS